MTHPLNEEKKEGISLKSLRLNAKLSKSKLASLSSVDPDTVRRAEEGQRVQDVKLSSILSTLNQCLSTTYSLEDLSDVQTV